MGLNSPCSLKHRLLLTVNAEQMHSVAEQETFFQRKKNTENTPNFIKTVLSSARVEGRGVLCAVLNSERTARKYKKQNSSKGFDSRQRRSSQTGLVPKPTKAAWELFDCSAFEEENGC